MTSRCSRSAITTTSLSGDDERSGDSGVDRGGVNSALAKAASTRLTISLAAEIDDLPGEKGKETNAFRNESSFFNSEYVANLLVFANSWCRIEVALLMHDGKWFIDETWIHRCVLFSDGCQ